MHWKLGPGQETDESAHSSISTSIKNQRTQHLHTHSHTSTVQSLVRGIFITRQTLAANFITTDCTVGIENTGEVCRIQLTAKWTVTMVVRDIIHTQVTAVAIVHRTFINIWRCFNNYLEKLPRVVNSSITCASDRHISGMSARLPPHAQLLAFGYTPFITITAKGLDKKWTAVARTR